MRRISYIAGLVCLAACEPVPMTQTDTAGIPACSDRPPVVVQGNVVQQMETCRDGQRIIVRPRATTTVVRPAPQTAQVSTTPLPPANGAAPANDAGVAPVIETDGGFAPEPITIDTPVTPPDAG